MIIKEACIENIQQGLNAVKQGADRLELCENLSVGGTTPSYGTLKTLLNLVEVPIFPMIRPRGGNFCYSRDEVTAMIEDIKLFKTLGIKGLVLGVSYINNEIDYELLGELLSYCEGLEVTFHKAIDEVKNPLEDIPKLEKLRIKRILTSGKEITALEGQNLLNLMIEKSSTLTIVVAGRVTVDNLGEVSSTINGIEFHGKKIVGELD